MLQRPNAVGLRVCQLALVEEKTKNVSLINCFRRLNFHVFPSPIMDLFVAFSLRDGLGKMELTLSILPLETLEDIFLRTWEADFPDPLREKWFLVPIKEMSFPKPGRYEFRLACGGDILAQAMLEILEVIDHA